MAPSRPHSGDDAGSGADGEPARPYTAREAAEFVLQGACMVAWPPDEIRVDPLSREGNGKGRMARG
ncbi:uncharacterized protein P884DRAFT_256514 [Thermothelomyces heterothallicus CBS 202.75]|uniref:uncharacterized protein n=1 Tax=Thermothelomyces heterothallicus CBS 202.75 TaxID=1149848 RepID=UPI003742EA55